MEKFYDVCMNALRDYVAKEYDGKNNAAARALNVSPSVLSQWLNGVRTPTLAAIGPVLDALGAEVSFSEKDDPLQDYVLVPKVKAIAGAGASFVVDDRTTGLYAFRREFLRREHINTADLVMMMVMGDSMEPLIREGDTVLVDQTDRDPIDGKIFVLRIEDALMVKRMQKIPGGWRVLSDNAERGFYDMRGEELEMMQIFGRVRWFGRVV